MTFRIYYSEDRVFDSSVTPDDLPPPRDIQVILQHDPERGPYFQSGSDYYVWQQENQRWRGVDIFGLFDYLMDSGLVLFGRTISQAEYSEIYQKAKGDKRTFLPGERHP